MHKHQLDVLIAELKRPEYDGLSADAAYAKVCEEHKRIARLPILSVVEGFPTGAPAMPNKVKRPDFDQAWSQRR